MSTLPNEVSDFETLYLNADVELQESLISCCSYRRFYQLSGKELDEILWCAAMGLLTNGFTDDELIIPPAELLI